MRTEAPTLSVRGLALLATAGHWYLKIKRRWANHVPGPWLILRLGAGLPSRLTRLNRLIGDKT